MADDGALVVVVGVDGSDDARTAADWARREAEAHGGRLVVVHVWSVPAFAAGPEVLWDSIRVGDYQKAAEQLVADEADRLRASGTGCEIETRLGFGSPVTALLDAAPDAGLIVVGSRGVGRVAGLFLGSVSQAVVTRARCPVLVVPPADGK